MNSKDVIAVILGGGRGERLYPLTKLRAKPAVPIAGKFRLIDIPISNCLHADLDRILVLTQFNSTSLHRHISQTYRFDSFSGGYVQILAAQQTQENIDWYQGTADAVRQNIRRIEETPCDYVLILSGDQLYRMDYKKMIREHLDHNAEITVAVLPVERDQVKEFGILKTNSDGRIIEFMEKPKEEDHLKFLEIENGALEQRGIDPRGRSHVASMGIYVFNKKALSEVLEYGNLIDFGKHVIPSTIGSKSVYAHYFDGYWRDVGTIKSFYDANLELTSLVPPFDFYNETARIYTRPRYLPGSKINKCDVESSILCEGSIITDSEIRNSVIGLRSIVNSGAKIFNSVIMGADYYDSMRDRCNSTEPIPTGIGRDSIITNTIVDKNARIGCNVRITNDQGIKDFNGDNFSIREGIIVIHKDAIIADNTVI